MPPDPPPPSLRLTIDKEALAANWRTLDRMSGDADAGAAVKADCYGLGVDKCVPVLHDAGAKAFFVAHWSEVADVVGHVEPSQVAVLHGPVRDADVAYARAIGALPVINSLEQARRWRECGGGACHLMVDTGINRLGVAASDLGDPAIAALDIDVLMSHLSSADEDFSPVNERQLDAFRGAVAQVPHRRASLANSAGIALGPDYAFNLTRPGLALYGGVPRADMASRLRQVAHIDVAILQTRVLNAGDAVGYNGTFVAEKQLPAATVSLGYADGFLRSRGPGGSLFDGATALPILGKVSMDMVVVDCTAAPHLREGDWITVPYDLPDAARQSSLSQYELLTMLGRRLRG